MSGEFLLIIVLQTTRSRLDGTSVIVERKSGSTFYVQNDVVIRQAF